MGARLHLRKRVETSGGKHAGVDPTGRGRVKVKSQDSPGSRRSCPGGSGSDTRSSSPGRTSSLGEAVRGCRWVMTSCCLVPSLQVQKYESMSVTMAINVSLTFELCVEGLNISFPRLTKESILLCMIGLRWCSYPNPNKPSLLMPKPNQSNQRWLAILRQSRVGHSFIILGKENCMKPPVN